MIGQLTYKDSALWHQLMQNLISSLNR
jgi:hypothetical protein